MKEGEAKSEPEEQAEWLSITMKRVTSSETRNVAIVGHLETIVTAMIVIE